MLSRPALERTSTRLVLSPNRPYSPVRNGLSRPLACLACSRVHAASIITHRAVVGEQPWPDEASTLSLPRQRPREFRMPVPQPWWRRIRSRFFVDRTRALA